MELENSLARLESVVGELEKLAANPPAAAAAPKGAQIDLFAAPRKTTSVDNTLMARKLDRTIERIENLLQVGSR